MDVSLVLHAEGADERAELVGLALYRAKSAGAIRSLPETLIQFQVTNQSDPLITGAIPGTASDPKWEAGDY
jgi:hypothetical protein